MILILKFTKFDGDQIKEAVEATRGAKLYFLLLEMWLILRLGLALFDEDKIEDGHSGKQQELISIFSDCAFTSVMDDNIQERRN